MIGLYAKAIGGAITAAAGAWISALHDAVVTGGEKVTIVVTLVVGLGAIAAIPNTPAWLAKYVPAGVAVVVATGAQLIVVLPDGITQAEILTLVVAVLTAAGLTAAVSNARKSDPPGGVVPASEVAVTKDVETGQLVAGDALESVPNDTPVEVTPA